MVSPACTVELIGGRVGALEAGPAAATVGPYVAGTTQVAAEDGLSPRWDMTFTAASWTPESSFVLLSVVNHRRSSSLLARACVPVTALRPGFRVLPLYSPNGSMLKGSCCFVHVAFEPLLQPVQTPAAVDV